MPSSEHHTPATTSDQTAIVDGSHILRRRPFHEKPRRLPPIASIIIAGHLCNLLRNIFRLLSNTISTPHQFRTFWNERIYHVYTKHTAAYLSCTSDLLHSAHSTHKPLCRSRPREGTKTRALRTYTSLLPFSLLLLWGYMSPDCLIAEYFPMPLNKT